MLVDNINILRNQFPLVWNHFKDNENKFEPELVQAVASKKGPLTLTFQQDGRTAYLHSQYDPLHEAEAIISKYKDIGKYKQVLFYGTGLGYHIEMFTAEYPDLPFSIYEPVPEIFDQYLSHQELNKLPLNSLKKIYVETSSADVEFFLQRFVEEIKGEVLIIELPSYKRFFSEKYQHFFKAFKDIIVNRRTGLGTDFAFEKRWTINSMMNFKEVLDTPDILVQKKGAFKDKPALLVAAGPSLDEDIENIRYIKDNGLAYIFSVGSAINSLLAHDIHPHAACTYDPTVANQKVFAKVCAERIKDIPLVFGSSVGFETLPSYPGPKLHMITNQDSVAQYYLKTDKIDTRLDFVADALSISIITLQVLYKLGFNPVILVGQNLAYKNDKHYASGIDYINNTKLNAGQLKDALVVDDVHGNKVYTNLTYKQMRDNMEALITQCSNMKVINSTEGGAMIRGTEFIPLDQVIKDILNIKVNKADWVDCNTFCYDIDYLRKRYIKMNNEYRDFKEQTNSLLELMKKIHNLKTSHHPERLDKIWPNFDKNFKKYINNKFFKVFILPMNRVQHDMLLRDAAGIRFINNAEAKAQMVIERFGSFIGRCYEDTINIKPLFDKVNEAIEEKIN